jgi:hypothetical protein
VVHEVFELLQRHAVELQLHRLLAVGTAEIFVLRVHRGDLVAAAQHLRHGRLDVREQGKLGIGLVDDLLPQLELVQQVEVGLPHLLHLDQVALLDLDALGQLHLAGLQRLPDQ